MRLTSLDKEIEAFQSQAGDAAETVRVLKQQLSEAQVDKSSGDKVLETLKAGAQKAAQMIAEMKERVAELRARIGLDQPIWRQYVTWLGGVFSGRRGRVFADGHGRDSGWATGWGATPASTMATKGNAVFSMGPR